MAPAQQLKQAPECLHSLAQCGVVACHEPWVLNIEIWIATIGNTTYQKPFIVSVRPFLNVVMRRSYNEAPQNHSIVHA